MSTETSHSTPAPTPARASKLLVSADGTIDVSAFLPLDEFTEIGRAHV